MILVVCALSAELDGFARPQNVEILAGGIGPVEAAACTARALALARYEAVVNAGIAGVFDGCGRVGDAFAVGWDMLADLGLEGGAPLTLPGGASLAEEAQASAALLAVARAAGLAVARGVTVTQVTTTDETARRLRARYSADVESMEGFAVMRAATLAGVPAIGLRGISNYVGDRTRSQWDSGAGIRATVAALEAFLMAFRVAT